MRVVVGAQAGGAVVGAAGGERRGVEGVDGVAVGGERDVRRVERLLRRHEPEVRHAGAEAGGTRELHQTR